MALAEPVSMLAARSLPREAAARRAGLARFVSTVAVRQVARAPPARPTAVGWRLALAPRAMEGLATTRPGLRVLVLAVPLLPAAVRMPVGEAPEWEAQEAPAAEASPRVVPRLGERRQATRRGRWVAVAPRRSPRASTPESKRGRAEPERATCCLLRAAVPDTRSAAVAEGPSFTVRDRGYPGALPGRAISCSTMISN